MNKKYLKNLKNLNILELKELCKKKKIKGYSKLNKEEIIKLIIYSTAHSTKGGSINDPVISIYTYKVLDLLETNNGLVVNSSSTSQKFNKFYPSLNSMGIIYPKEYINNMGIKHNFTLNSYISDAKYYSIDPLISNSVDISRQLSTTPKLGGSKFNMTAGTKENIQNYYNFYLNKKTKVKSFTNDGKPFYNNNRANDIYNTLNQALLITNHYISNNKTTNIGNDIDPVDRINGAYIFNIEIQENEKLIIFGDLHGSYHSFFRIFTRLHILGVINFPEFIINEGYRIIFLGDIADRGQYALEIFYIISKFIINNNTDTLLKIIINRGNHEDPRIWHNGEFGFDKEIKQKFEHKNYKLTNKNPDAVITYEDIINIMINLLSYCSTAIILKYINNKYWLCHGGFPIGVPSERTIFQIPSDKIKFYEPVDYIPYQIRWSDFTNTHESSIDMRTNRPQIGIIKLKQFMTKNKIKFIIRGHTDNIDNAFLLMNNAQYALSLNNIELLRINKDSKIIFPDELYGSNIVDNLRQVDGPVIRLETNNWLDNGTGKSNIFMKLSEDDEEDKDEDEEYNKVYPVLTISTNSDLQRDLNNDSFIVFNFSNDNDFNKLNIDAIIEYFKSFNKTNRKTVPSGIAHNN